jgi:hypothetical protein
VLVSGLDLDRVRRVARDVRRMGPGAPNMIAWEGLDNEMSTEGQPADPAEDIVEP